MSSLFNQDKLANEMYEAAANSNVSNRKYLGMSEIGKPCELSLWLSFRRISRIPLDGRVFMLFRFGDRIEEEIIKWLDLAGYKVDGQQDGFSDHNGFFRGHCDGNIHGITSQIHTLEVKSCNSKKFKAFKDNGIRKTYPVYYSQAQCYMGYGNLERALFIVQCKDTSEIYTERIYFNRFDFEDLRERASRVINTNQAVGPQFKESSFECTYCDFRFFCRGEHIQMEKDQVCGNCHYLTFQDCKPSCNHPGHAFPIETWGIKCDDYNFLFKKEFMEVNGKKIRINGGE